MCRVYDSNAGNVFQGAIDNDKWVGEGKMYDKSKDEVYEGEFQNNKRHGDGIIYYRSGKVAKYHFRENNIEGDCINMPSIPRNEVKKVFNNATKVQ